MVSGVHEPSLFTVQSNVLTSNVESPPDLAAPLQTTKQAESCLPFFATILCHTHHQFGLSCQFQDPLVDQGPWGTY